jgi:hypothetical protein
MTWRGCARLSRRCANGGHDLADAPGKVIFDVVLPEPDHCPSVIPKDAIDLGIAFHVSADLGLPEESIGLWCHAVLRTRMPEATVNENSDSGGDEREVGPSGKSASEPVAQPGAPERKA